ncbi:MAG: hypothetical protein E3K38_06560 [Candidatus Kuenenia stuttgartiensis]|nr:hypothetical protein [Candidatus Kuenenia stuttgartiensis]
MIQAMEIINGCRKVRFVPEKRNILNQTETTGFSLIEYIFSHSDNTIFLNCLPRSS